MKEIGCLRKNKFGVLQLALMALTLAGHSAHAQITATPVPPFTGSGTTTVTTGAATGTFAGVSVSDTAGPATVTLGQTTGGALTLNNAVLGVPNEISLVNTVGSTTTVTVLASAALTDSSAGMNPNTILITGDGTVTNAGSIVVEAPAVGGNAVSITGAGTVNNTGTITAGSGGTALDSVVLGNGGTVTNSATGMIVGDTNGIEIKTLPGTITNMGQISGDGAGMDTGVLLDAGGSVTNTNTGTITGTTFGVNVLAGAATVTNSGTISGTNGGDTGNTGVFLQGGGTVTNSTGGNIKGDMVGVDIKGGTAAGNMLVNSGTIQSNAGNGTFGASLEIGGSVTNTSSGTITGVTSGVSMAGGTFATNTVTNTGLIVGQTANGVVLTTGTVNNGMSGTLKGATDAISIAGQGAVSNSGTIEAGTTGISLGMAGANSSVTLQNGSIGAIPGNPAPMNDVVLMNATAATTVTIDARTLLTSTGTNLVGGGGTLVLHLIGITAAQQAAINNANPNMATLTAGGETYSISGFSAIVNQSTSFASVVDPGLNDLANKLDAIGLPNNPVYDVFYNSALSNPEAAVASLSGRVLTQGVNDVEINSRNGLISDLSNQFEGQMDTDNIGGIDLSHFNIGTSQMLAFTDTSSQLDNLMNIANSRMGGTEMSDSKRMTPVSAPESTAKWGVWASGTIQVADKDNSTGNTGFHALNGSPSLGVDYRISRDVTIGALFSYTTVGADFDDGSRIDSSTELGGLYALYQHDGWRVHAMAAGGASQYENTRTTFGGNASSSPDGTDVISDLTGGYQFKLCTNGALRVTPEAGLQYTHLQQDGFSESGPAAFAISRGNFDADSLRTHIGFRSDYAIQAGPGLQFIPEVRAAWYHECLDDAAGVNTSLTGAPALGSFSVRTFDPERDYALVGIGLNTAFTGYHGMPMGVFVNYDVQVGQDDFIQHNVNLGIRASF